MKTFYSDNFRVEHEPLGFDYVPRLTLGMSPSEIATKEPRIVKHADQIETTLENKSYIECGWPTFGAMPYMVKRFKNRIQVVHLTRHPVATAWSMVAHHYFHERPRDDFIEGKALLHPTGPGVRFGRSYVDKWKELSTFEKCLYFWMEVTLSIIQGYKEWNIQWHRTFFETMFLKDYRELKKLLIFLELEQKKDFYNQVKERKDDHFMRTNIRVDPRLILKHPAVIKLARQLGYNPTNINKNALQSRYEKRGRLWA